METLKEQIKHDKLPNHVAVIMDGNGRWARQKGKDRIFGHQNGVTSVRNTVECAAETGINWLTLYAFSTENWNRPPEEVNALMELFVQTIKSEVPSLQKNNIALHAIGDIQSLPENCRIDLSKAMADTAANTRLNLVIAVSYSARWDIANAMKKIADNIEKKILTKEQINESVIKKHLTTAGFPEPELLIRTGGEKRISNFLLWEMAYTELYFTNKHWPEFGKEDFLEAVLDYQKRERRFGKTSEQINVKT